MDTITISAALGRIAMAINNVAEAIKGQVSLNASTYEGRRQVVDLVTNPVTGASEKRFADTLNPEEYAQVFGHSGDAKRPCGEQIVLLLDRETRNFPHMVEMLDGKKIKTVDLYRLRPYEWRQLVDNKGKIRSIAQQNEYLGRRRAKVKSRPVTEGDLTL